MVKGVIGDAVLVDDDMLWRGVSECEISTSRFLVVADDVLSYFDWVLYE